jgi:hypothetical protein
MARRIEEWPDPPPYREFSHHVSIAPGVLMVAVEGQVELELPGFNFDWHWVQVEPRKLPPGPAMRRD